ncbi:MAG: lipid-A-disaccharide synthase [Gemmatimonadota bacterium]
MGGTPPRIWISAGEPSGDLHGAHVVEALRQRFPGATIGGFGGPRMAAAGAELSVRMEALSAFGFSEVVTKIPAHYRLLRQLRREFASGKWDLVILIDYPGFHLRVAEAARTAGIKVLYYIAPQLWAWAPGRARRFAAAVDRMAVVLPFETEFFARAGIKAEYVGHPLVDRPPWPDRDAARRELELPEPARVLGIFPGSRDQEVERLWPLFRAVALQMLAEGRCTHAIVAGTGTGRYPEPGPIVIHRGDPVPVFVSADAALAKSGTTTLEAALAGVPMVVSYLTSIGTYIIGRFLITTELISLVNLVIGRMLVPEIWKRPVRPAELAAAIRPLLDPASPERLAQLAGLAEVVRRLGDPGAAGRVARIAAELLGE